MSTKTAAGAATALMVAVGLALLAFFGMGGPQLAVATCDTNSFNLMSEAMKSVGVEQRYKAQEALAPCTNLDQYRGVKGGSSSAAPTSKAPLVEGKRNWEYLANRPAPEKVAINAFGPKIALAESNHGKDMGSLDASEAHEELRYRLSVDPMLTAATANALGLIAGNEVDSKTVLYASDWKAWDAMNLQIAGRLNGMTREVQEIPAGTQVPMQYAMPGDTPLVVMDHRVTFPYSIHVIIFTDAAGKKYSARLECGLQWREATVQAMPQPSPGLTRTPEGTPQVEKPPSSMTTPPVTTTTVVTTTPPVTTTTTYTCPNGGQPPACSKTSASQPPGVGSPTSNPVGTPTSKPTQTSPLQPSPPAEPTRTSVPPVEGTSTTHSGVPTRPGG